MPKASFAYKVQFMRKKKKKSQDDFHGRNFDNKSSVF